MAAGSRIRNQRVQVQPLRDGRSSHGRDAEEAVSLRLERTQIKRKRWHLAELLLFNLFYIGGLNLALFRYFLSLRLNLKLIPLMFHLKGGAANLNFRLYRPKRRRHKAGYASLAQRQKLQRRSLYAPRAERGVLAAGVFRRCSQGSGQVYAVKPIHLMSRKSSFD